MLIACLSSTNFHIIQRKHSQLRPTKYLPLKAGPPLLWLRPRLRLCSEVILKARAPSIHRKLVLITGLPLLRLGRMLRLRIEVIRVPLLRLGLKPLRSDMILKAIKVGPPLKLRLRIDMILKPILLCLLVMLLDPAIDLLSGLTPPSIYRCDCVPPRESFLSLRPGSICCFIPGSSCEPILRNSTERNIFI